MTPVTGHTRLCALIGDPVRHSLSPAIHNTAYELLDLDYVYTVFPVPAEHFKEGMQALRALGLAGYNVTMPGKKIAAETVDVISREAALSHSVNTIVIRDGKLYGYSTDGYGFMETMRRSGIDLTGRTLSLLGTGGAARAICVQAALDGVGEIVMFRRKNPEKWARAEAFADHIADETGCRIHIEDIDDAALLKETVGRSPVLANATNVGMEPHPDGSPIRDPGIFTPSLTVFDVIYHPRTTKLLQEAAAAGCRTIDGIPMLVHQAALAFRYITGEEMPVDEVIRRLF